MKLSPYTAPGIISFTPLLEALLREICAVYGVKVSDIKGKCKKRQYASVRQVYAYAATLHYPNLSKTSIGRAINNDHSTIVNNELKGLQRIMTEQKYRTGYNQVRRRLFPTVDELTADKIANSSKHHRKNK